MIKLSSWWAASEGYKRQVSLAAVYVVGLFVCWCCKINAENKTLTSQKNNGGGCVCVILRTKMKKQTAGKGGALGEIRNQQDKKPTQSLGAPKAKHLAPRENP